MQLVGRIDFGVVCDALEALDAFLGSYRCFLGLLKGLLPFAWKRRMIVNTVMGKIEVILPISARPLSTFVKFSVLP